MKYAHMETAPTEVQSGIEEAALVNSLFPVRNVLRGRKTRHKRTIRQRLVHRRNQVSLHQHFHDITQSPCGKTSGQNVRVLVHGKKSDLCFISAPLEFSGD